MKANGTALRALRTAKGISVTALAEAVGVKQPHVTNVEQEDRSCSPRLAVAITRHMGVPVSVALRNRDYPDADLIEHLIGTDDMDGLRDVLGFEAAKAAMARRAEVA